MAALWQKYTSLALGLLLATTLKPSALWAAPLLGVEPSGKTLLIRTGTKTTFLIEKNTTNEVVVLLSGVEVGSLSASQNNALGEVQLQAVTGGMRLIYKPRLLGTSFEVVASPDGQAIAIQPANALAQLPPAPPSGTSPSTAPLAIRVTLKVRDGDVKDTLTLLGRVSKANVVTDSSVTGKVSLNLEKVTFAEALSALAAAAGLVVNRTDGDVYVISQTKPGGGLTQLPIAPNPGGGGTDVSGRVVNINVKNAQIGSVIENMANQSGAQLIIKGGILQDQVTARLSNVPFEKALDQLLTGTRFGYVRQGQVYLIGDTSQGTLTGQALQSTEVIALAYTPAKNVTTLLPSILSQYIKPDATRNAVVITATQTLRNQIKDLIKEIDKPLKQVVFEVKIVELSETGSRALNALASLQTGSTVGDTANGSNNNSALNLAGQIATTDSLPTLNGIARILQTVSGLIGRGEGRLVTDTKLNTVSGKKAAIDVQTDINISLQNTATLNGVGTVNQTITTLRAGTLVEIEPTVQADGNVLAILNLESSIPGTQTNANTAPNISRRKVKNTLLLKDGQTIEIGGLLQNNRTENTTKFPILGYIPFIGEFFSNTSYNIEQRELVVFITPRIRDVEITSDQRLSVPAAEAR
jgi:type IV pilus assembly protein PilQ